MLKMNHLLITFVSILISITQVNGQGFVCDGMVYYQAKPIPTSLKRNMLFYGRDTSSSTTDCARKCFRKEFCRFSVFDPRDETCEFSYSNSKLDCEPDERVRIFTATSTTAIHCIQCPTGYRVTGIPGNGTVFDELDSGGVATTKTSKTNAVPQQKSAVLVSIFTSAPVTSPVTDKSEEDSCFSVTSRRVLVGVSFAAYKVSSVAECKCLCSKTWQRNQSRRRSEKCQSFMFYPSRKECVLNSRTSDDNKFPIVPFLGDYVALYELQCRRRDEIRQLLLKCKKDTSSVERETTTLKISGDYDVIESDECFTKIAEHVLSDFQGAIELNTNENSCKCMCAASMMSARYSFKCQSIMFYPTNGMCILNTQNHRQRPDKFHPDRTSVVVSYYALVCDHGADRRSYVQNTCDNVDNLEPFDENSFLVDGQVSLRTKVETVTQPFLSPFLDSEQVNRNQPLPFDSETPRESDRFLRNLIRASTVRPLLTTERPFVGLRELSTSSPSRTRTVFPHSGENSDSCFSEAKRHTLVTGEGYGLLRGNVTLSECKCLCADSLGSNGFECGSMMYYYERNACVVHMFSHATHPRDFYLDRSQNQRFSYFAYFCSNENGSSFVYRKRLCIVNAN